MDPVPLSHPITVVVVADEPEQLEDLVVMSRDVVRFGIGEPV